MKFLGARGIGHADIPSKMKGKLLRLNLPYQEGSRTWSGPVWILETAPSSLGCITSLCITPALLPSDLKAVSFVWGLDQEAVLLQVQAAVKVALPLGPYDPVVLTVLEVPVADKNAI